MLTINYNNVSDSVKQKLYVFRFFYTTPIRLNKNLFPQVKWEDKEPTKVELTIKIYE